jgi:hypothetical protein
MARLSHLEGQGQQLESDSEPSEGSGDTFPTPLQNTPAANHGISTEAPANRMHPSGPMVPNLLQFIPKLPPPRVYHNSNRKEYNNWVRDVEGYILNDTNFPTPQMKLNYAEHYIDETRRDRWESKKRILDLKDRDWTHLKQEMLECLGNRWEREQRARENLKRMQQGADDPTKLLNRMRTEWEDIDPEKAAEDGNKDHIAELHAALHPTLKEYLYLQAREWTSLTDLETNANYLWRGFKEKQRNNKRSQEDPNVEQQRPKKAQKGPQGSQPNPAKDQGGYSNLRKGKQPKGQYRKEKAKQELKKKDRETNACYRCHSTEHWARDCPTRDDNSNNEPQKPKPPKPKGLPGGDKKIGAVIYTETQQREAKGDHSRSEGPKSGSIRAQGALLGPQSHGLNPVTMLVDSGADINIVNPELVKLAGWKITPLKPNDGYKTLNGQNLHMFGHTEGLVKVFDDYGKSETARVAFTIGAIEGYDMVLGMPWLEVLNPIPNFYSKTIRFAPNRSRRDPIRTINVREMEDEFRDKKSDKYVMHVTSLDQEDKENWPPEYEDLRGFCNEEEAAKLPSLEGISMGIELLPDKKPPYGPLYNLSRTEMDVLKKYIDDYLKRGWIRHSKSPAGAPILFSKKKDGGLRLCVDYRGINAITIKNRHPLPLIQESLDRLGQATIFTKIDLRDAYHRIRIKEGDEWKTAFRTRYGHFEYTVVPFGLTNAPAIFQAHINKVLADFMDTCCIVYLDDILIFSRTRDEHIQHVRAIIKRLLAHNLFAKASKCEFHKDRVSFLGYMVTPNGVQMEPDRVKTVQDWPTPKTVREIRIFLGFANYYRRFIQNYSKIAAPLMDLMKKAPGSAIGGHSQRKEESVPLILDLEAQNAFNKLKQAFAKGPILRHYEPELPLKLETDASGFAICAILSQLHTEGPSKPKWHPIAFYSRKLSSAERNYDTHDKELLAIVQAFKHWRQYLEGVEQEVELWTDHNALCKFMETKALIGRQIRWAEWLSVFNFKIRHKPGTKNPADGPSRRPDYETGQDEKQEDSSNAHRVLREKLNLEGNTNYVGAVRWSPRNLPKHQRDLLMLEEEIRALRRKIDQRKGHSGPRRSRMAPRPTPAYKVRKNRVFPRVHRQGEYPFIGAITRSKQPTTTREGWKAPGEATRTQPGPILPNIPTIETWDELKSYLRAWEDEFITKLERECGDPKGPAWTKRWQKRGGLWQMDGKIFIPEGLRIPVLHFCHDTAFGGHFGISRTISKVMRNFWWPGVRSYVKDYVSSCEACGRAKKPKRKPFGLLQPLPIPNRPWADISMDFVTGLPESAVGKNQYNSILVVVDRFSKMAHYFPTRDDIKAMDLAELFWNQIVRYYYQVESIVTDRGSLFTSTYWETFCDQLNTKRRLSTAFHPQTDGQTERQNQVLEQYLRTYCNYEQDDWANLLVAAELAYNDSQHDSLSCTPFYMLYGCPMTQQYQPEQHKGRRYNANAFKRATNLTDIRERMKENLRKAKETQQKYYNQHRKEAPTFKKGQYVWLDARNIKTKRPMKKLDYSRIKCKILEQLGPVTYRLELPETLQIHNVFHVTLLDPCSESGPKRKQPPAYDIYGEDEQTYEIDDITEAKKDDKGWLYRVHWKGYDENEDEWLPAEQIHPSAVRKYHKKYKEKRQRRR